jgi:hypothetical protein
VTEESSRAGFPTNPATTNQPPPAKRKLAVYEGTASDSWCDLDDDATQYIAGLHRRRSATYRIPRFDHCPCVDPWTCRCQQPELTTESYVAAAHHLLDLDLPPAPDLPAMRALWRRGERNLVRDITSRWEVAA